VTANPIDTPEYFVRQQYLDFLGREPDQAGLAFWAGKINQCNGEAGCLRQQRIDVSAAFFGSQEFRETGSFIYRLYQAGLGRQIGYNEFAADRQQVIGGANLEAARTAFATAFVQREDFVRKYLASTSGEAFVDAILQTINDTTGVDLSDQRQTLISRYQAGATINESRAFVLREASDRTDFASAVYNPSFVLMEYFGYLRRGHDQGGYDFWLNKLNSSAGNYRGMVCSFMTSAEYQGRFGTLITHTNAECSGQ
jgi:hypothetical protein